MTRRSPFCITLQLCSSIYEAGLSILGWGLHKEGFIAMPLINLQGLCSVSNDLLSRIGGRKQRLVICHFGWHVIEAGTFTTGDTKLSHSSP